MDRVNSKGHMMTPGALLKTEGIPGSQALGLKSVVSALDKAQVGKASVST